MKDATLLTKHPCFSKEASKKYGRVHLPVAPRCNISCNYCNRKYDCSNECRPGVTSKVMTPLEAMDKIRYVKKKMPELTTVGIAGPGDSLANPDQTFETLAMIRSEFPQMNLCISTNGLMLAEYAQDLLDVNAIYITVTVNAVQSSVASDVYRRVRYNGQNYYGEEGAALLLERQRLGLEKLKGTRAVIKVNSVLMPGINDDQIEGIRDLASANGAYLMNIMPLIPVEGSMMEGRRSPSAVELETAHQAVSSRMHLMDHCQQCRSDACGLLEEKEVSIHNVDSCTSRQEYSVSL